MIYENNPLFTFQPDIPGVKYDLYHLKGQSSLTFAKVILSLPLNV